MAIGDTNITVVGNMVGDPELRFTPSGNAVANFRIASTPRVFNRQSNQYEDGDALFLTVNVWRQAAENIAQSLSKGMRVIVTGRLKQRTYETSEGDKRTVFEIEADDVGPSLTFARANVQRNPRGTGNQPSGQPDSQTQQSTGWNTQAAPQGGFSQQPTNDTWNSQPAPLGGADDEPPF